MKIVVEPKFGSKSKESFGITSLMAVLESWKLFCESQHKKTKIQIRIKEDK